MTTVGRVIWALGIVWVSGQVVQAIVVPPCDRSRTCISSTVDCPVGEHWSPVGGQGGCCPGCVAGPSVGELCDGQGPACAPGLFCAVVRATGQGVCQMDTGNCLSTQHVDERVSWVPTCDNGGQFAAKQCRGDRTTGRCFCYSATGQRIFGWDWRGKATDMTCACSRHRWQLEADGRFDVTLHCTQNGNYEELQCDAGLCWCVNPKSGHQVPGTRAIPEALWQLLPCYNATTSGTSYLRQCESAAAAQIAQRKKFIAHGHLHVAFTDIQCDYDGSHGLYTIEGQEAFCVRRDGGKLESYKTPLRRVKSMNCNCARDRETYAAAGLELKLICETNGNYATVQVHNGELFCVDQNGFVVAENVADEQQCEQYMIW